jgi:mevalonate kinase
VAGSLIYVGTHAITQGKLDVAKAVSREMGAFLEANHPRMLHFEIYIDDDAHEMTVIQIHPDEDSLALHLKLARERIAKAYDFLDATTKINIYGRPSDAMIDRIRQMAMGAPIRFNVATAGFSRLTSVGV